MAVNLQTEYVLSAKQKWFIRGTVTVFCLLFLAWILNKNVAFTGTYTVSLRSFLHLPPSVQYTGGGDIGVVATPSGLRARPYTDSMKFAVTLPRGFDTLTMTAEVEADPYATLTLNAKAGAASNHATSFRLPTAFGTGWRSIALGNGRLHLRGHESIQDAESFWSNFHILKRVYTAGGDLASYVPTNLYAPTYQLHDVHIGADFRGSLTLSAFLGSESTSLQFAKRDLDYVAGDDTLRFTLERGGVVLASQDVHDGNGSDQRVTVALPALESGFYTLRFTPNNEDSIVRNIQFRGTDVRIENKMFLGQVSTTLTLYTQCQKFSAEAAHNVGLQSSLTVNGKKVNFNALKKPQEVQLTGPLSTLVIPRGDVSLTSSCGFQLTSEQPVREAFRAFVKRIVFLADFSSEGLQNADVVYDDTQLAQEATKSTYAVEKTFNLHQLSAKQKTFTFYLDSPGLTKRSGAYLHVKNLRFTAHRPPFSLRDMQKLFKKLL